MPPEIKDILAKLDGIEKSIAEAVDVVTEEKLKAHKEELKKELADLQKQFSDIVAAAKFADGENTDEEKAEKAHSVIAKSFRKIYSQGVQTEEKSAEIISAEVKAAFQNEGTAGEGAEFVFAEFDRNVFYALKAYPLINELAVINIKGTTITLPKWLNTVEAYWTDEGAAITTSKGGTDKVVYTVSKLATLVPVTDEMFDDNMTDEDLYSLIVMSATNSHAAKIENGVINGDSTRMAGIIPDANVAVVSIATGNTTLRGASASAVDDFLVDLDTAIADEYQTNPANLVAVMSKYTLSQYKKKKTTDGKFLYPELREANPMLLGKYRVITSSKAPVQNQAADVAGAKHTLIGDLKSFYRVVRRKGISATRGFATGDFESGKSSIKIEQRLTGGPITGLGFAVGKNSAT
jgi:HK97 family phage major capsid protein